MLQQRVAGTGRTAAEKRAHLMREIVETLLFVGLVFFLVQFGIGSFPAGDTMQPQLHPDEYIIVNKWAYLFGGPSRGDVVVYDLPTNLSTRLIARVVAVPGDTIAVTPTSIVVNDVTLNEPYVQAPPGFSPNSRVVPQEKLGPNEYFLLNDSRLVSPDSRTFGTVKRGNIVGKAELVFWPLKSVRGIPTYSNVFSHVSR
ncbi:MAG TPA: signal peptidase I [Ktedonobacterales bacterium]|nr:signal peptidase I [Ktedonobacterales bacterium]